MESHAYGPHSATPTLHRARRSGGPSLYVSLVVLSRDTVHPEALREAVSLDIGNAGDEGGATVRLTFLDGTVAAV